MSLATFMEKDHKVLNRKKFFQWFKGFYFETFGSRDRTLPQVGEIRGDFAWLHRVLKIYYLEKSKSEKLLLINIHLNPQH